jgi:hypothetical protein
VAKSGTNVHPKSELRRLKDPISSVFGQTESSPMRWAQKSPC